MSVFSTVATLFSRKTGPKKAGWYRPLLERLEDRVNPGVEAIWIGPVGGAWSAAANWSTGAVPNSGTDCYLGSSYPGGTNNSSIITSDITVESVTCASGYGGITVEAKLTGSVTSNASI